VGVQGVNNGDGVPPFSSSSCTIPAPPNPCSVSTDYGLVAGGSQVKLSGASSYVPLTRPFILPIPYSEAFFSEDTSPPYTGGVNLFYYNDFLKAITANEDGFGNITSYTVTSVPDARLRDAQGNLQSVDENSIAFSGNGKWLVGASPAYMELVGLTGDPTNPLQTFFFGPQTQYDLGQAPNYRMAVSDDGRYVAFGQAFNGTSLFVEDLSKCPSQSPLTGAFQCQTIDVSSVLAALLPGYYRATPWQFVDDHTLVVYAAYKDANGVTHQAKVTMTSAAG
jgi:hypothetical protein